MKSLCGHYSPILDAIEFKFQAATGSIGNHRIQIIATSKRGYERAAFDSSTSYLPPGLVVHDYRFQWGRGVQAVSGWGCVWQAVWYILSATQVFNGRQEKKI